MIPVKIASISRETPTIKSFTLDLCDQAFLFKPGQWIDCYVDLDGERKVAGYSITSSPLEKDSFSIAVKLVGDNAVTDYMHESAKVGDTLYVDGGQGDFYYKRDIGDSIVLIAGGIGITPLMSIMRYVNEAATDVRATLVYSVKSPEEFAFREELDIINRARENVNVLYTVTGQHDDSWRDHVGRIDGALLQKARVNNDDLFFICGPPSMIRDMIVLIQCMGIDDSRIRYEQWW